MNLDARPFYSEGACTTHREQENRRVLDREPPGGLTAQEYSHAQGI